MNGLGEEGDEDGDGYEWNYGVPPVDDGTGEVGMSPEELGGLLVVKGVGLPDRYGNVAGGILKNRVRGVAGGRALDQRFAHLPDEVDARAERTGAPPAKRRRADGSITPLGIRWVDALLPDAAKAKHAATLPKTQPDAFHEGTLTAVKLFYKHLEPARITIPKGPLPGAGDAGDAAAEPEPEMDAAGADSGSYASASDRFKEASKRERMAEHQNVPKAFKLQGVDLKAVLSRFKLGAGAGGLGAALGGLRALTPASPAAGASTTAAAGGAKALPMRLQPECALSVGPDGTKARIVDRPVERLSPAPLSVPTAEFTAQTAYVAAEENAPVVYMSPHIPPAPSVARSAFIGLAPNHEPLAIPPPPKVPPPPPAVPQLPPPGSQQPLQMLQPFPASLPMQSQAPPPPMQAQPSAYAQLGGPAPSLPGMPMPQQPYAPAAGIPPHPYGAPPIQPLQPLDPMQPMRALQPGEYAPPPQQQPQPPQYGYGTAAYPPQPYQPTYPGVHAPPQAYPTQQQQPPPPAAGYPGMAPYRPPSYPSGYLGDGSPYPGAAAPIAGVPGAPAAPGYPGGAAGMRPAVGMDKDSQDRINATRLASTKRGTKPCLFYATPKGCRSGVMCPFRHDQDFVPSAEQLLAISRDAPDRDKRVFPGFAPESKPALRAPLSADELKAYLEAQEEAVRKRELGIQATYDVPRLLPTAGNQQLQQPQQQHHQQGYQPQQQPQQAIQQQYGYSQVPPAYAPAPPQVPPGHQQQYYPQAPAAPADGWQKQQPPPQQQYYYPPPQ